MGGFGAKAAYAARLYLEPATGTYDNGSEFSVKVKIDRGTESVTAADAILNFDATRLEVKTIAEGGFFEEMSSTFSNTEGKISIWTFQTVAISTPTQTTGDLATITFKTKAVGTASVSFVCQTGLDTDSSVWSPTGDDLISCAANGSGSYTVGAAASGGTTAPTSTPAPTATTAAGSNTNTPTPSQLPATGVDTPLLIFAVSGGIILLLGLLTAL